MGFYGTICEIHTAENKEFEILVDELLAKCGKDDTVLRLVFFGKNENNGDYSKKLSIIKAKVCSCFGEKSPVFSYVGQCPLVGDLVLEVYKVDRESNVKITYCSEGDLCYLKIEDDEHKELVIGGVWGGDPDSGIKGQSDRIFGTVGKILKKESFGIDGIVRQWNYIERITDFDDEHQHYQDFNDSRSHFYAQTEWKHGYPAATGIGTQFGGVVIDLNAVKPKTAQFRDVPLDNELQVAAHVYSQGVLLGARDDIFKHKTTPKFERAKAVTGSEKGIIYISGTAAIRGEQSLEGVGILVQTGITMENINFLISKDNLKKHGITPLSEPKIGLLRVYIKNPEDITPVRVYMEKMFTGIPVSYLLADVCRDELLIEIEGMASFCLA